MFDKNNCYNGGNKHNFEPRYTEEPNPLFSGAKIKGYSNLEDMLILKKYKGDICIWCGKVVNNANLDT